MSRPEEILQEQLAKYMVRQYPNVLFHSDFGSGARLTPGQANKQKRQNGGRRAWPDLEIAQPRVGRLEFGPIKAGMDENGHAYRLSQQVKLPPQVYCGLYLELKKDGEKLHPGPKAKKRYKSKDGLEYKTEHLMEQADVLYDLRQCGYWAAFAIGFDEAKRMIDQYLGNPEAEKVEF